MPQAAIIPAASRGITTLNSFNISTSLLKDTNKLPDIMHQLYPSNASPNNTNTNNNNNNKIIIQIHQETLRSLELTHYHLQKNQLLR